MTSILLPIIVATILIAILLGKPYWREFKRARIKRMPFKKQWRKIIQQRMPYFRKMPAHLQLQLKQHIQVFMAEKKFIGVNGVLISDDIKLTIAAQACLLIMNRKTDYYPKLRTILVYPRAFVKEQLASDADGVHFTEDLTLLGESWGTGTIVLSWQDTVAGAYIPDDGHNVVIHEFAHQLDQEDGAANGAPILNKDQNYEQWADVLGSHFQQLKEQLAKRESSLFDTSLIGSYGASNPAEFFAVASEVYFERSLELKSQCPLLHQQLASYYCIDPTQWE